MIPEGPGGQEFTTARTVPGPGIDLGQNAMAQAGPAVVPQIVFQIPGRKAVRQSLGLGPVQALEQKIPHQEGLEGP